MSDEAQVNLEAVQAKIQTLDVKDKLLVITSDDRFTHSQLATLRGSIKAIGGLGVLYLPGDADVKAQTIDECIKQLQAMKAQQAAKPSTKGIMTEPD